MKASDFTYWDLVFVRAVELGCSPVQLGTEFSPLWGCTCKYRKHAHATGEPIITRASLDHLERKLLT